MNIAHDYPRLCGGTFFTLILEATNQKQKERKKLGDNNNFTESDVFEALFNVAFIGCSRSNDKDNYKSAVAAYKNCTSKNSGRIPLTEQAAISTFDNMVKADYQRLLVAMNGFVCKYINIDGKGVWLVRALLELIAVDKNIDDVGLYISQDGQVIKKAALGDIDEFCLPAFLLGAWHYIIKNVPDNRVGKATYDEWRKPGKSRNSRESFKSDIGESLSNRKIVLIPLVEPHSNYDSEAEIHIEDSAEPSDKRSTEQGEPHSRVETTEPKYQQNNYIQTINVNSDNNIINGFVFIKD